MSALQPPRINTTDPNQQEISDDDHFSSASEGTQSPVPITRVERVDDTAAHGEVPGTPAYDLRTADAVPDEIEIVPEGRRSRSATLAEGGRGRASSALSGTGSARGSPRPSTPGGSPIPKTVVEKVDFKPSHGEVDGTPAKEMRMADAMPDEVRSAPPEARKPLEGRSPILTSTEPPEESEEGRQAWFRSMWESDEQDQDGNRDTNWDAKAADNAGNENDDDDDDDFGDDFDDFAEGGGDDADFGDFDEAEDSLSHAQQQQPPANIPPAPDVLAGLPLLDLTDLTTPAEVTEAITPYIQNIFPNATPIDLSIDIANIPQPQSFLSDRSLSLWQQLVSPPPMQPPNWTRSRIRRLFLVSLGVPVDLDEILPPSKQKRLILPSIGLDGSPRPSMAIERLRAGAEGNESTTSLDSKTGAPRPSTKRPVRVVKGPPPPPEFDANTASLLAATTLEALEGYSDTELRVHVVELGTLNERASRVLEYWLERRDEGLKEKEALDGVIENLVGFVKGRRKGGG